MNENNIKLDAQSWGELTFKDKVAYIVTISAFVIGAAHAIAGLFIEPIGEIHPTVITMTGLFLSFSGALLGISHHFNNELEKFESETIKILNETTKR